MIILQAQQVARYFGATTLFEKVNLSIQDHDRIGLVGINGAGKTTLLRILAKLDPTDAGQVIMTKGLSIGYLAQNSGLNSQKTILAEMTSVFAHLQKMEAQLHELEAKLGQEPDNEQLLHDYDQLQTQFKAKNGYGYPAEIRSILHGFQFPPEMFDHKIASLSGGERSRLALAKLLLQKPQLLILDEPTNHLDIETLNWLEGYLQNYDGALLLVSHDQYFLDHLAKDIYALSAHELRHYHGNYSRYLTQRDQQQLQAEKAYEKQQAEIKKLTTFVDKNIVRASTTKRAQSRRKQLAKMTRLKKPTDPEQAAHFNFEITKQTGKEVLQVEQLAIGFADETLSAPINFDVRQKDRLAIIGPNGIGKSTLVKTLLKQLPALAGQFKFGANVKIGYYDQNQDQLDPKKTVLDTVWDEHPLQPEQEIRSFLGAFLFSGDDVAKQVQQLSGGEKARLLLTKLALEKNNVLLMDEPTNHLDIQSKEVLETALSRFAGTLIFVSHDRYFINELATSVMALDKDGSHLYPGNYDDYLDRRQQEPDVAHKETKKATISDNEAQFKADKQRQKQERRLRRQAKQLEKKLDALNQENQQLQNQMAKPDVQKDFNQLADLQQQVEAKQKEIDTTEEQWLQAADQLDAFTEKN